MKKWLWIILLLLVLPGCSNSFKADLTTPVDASLQIGQLQQLSSDAGVLYEWFLVNNAFTEAEGKEVQSYYNEMLRVMNKLRNKAIAGQVDYHRLLYGLEDLTDAWEDLRPALQGQINIIGSDNPAIRLEDKLAIAMWNTLSIDMDNILASTNAALANAREDMDEETYNAFKNDVKGIMKTFSPLVKLGMGGLGI